MKKVFLFTLALSFNLAALNAQACQQGDLSKTLLITAEYQGEENAVLGEIDNRTGAVTAKRFGNVKTNGPLIAIKMITGQIFKFDRRQATKTTRFCFPVIFGN